MALQKISLSRKKELEKKVFCCFAVMKYSDKSLRVGLLLLPQLLFGKGECGFVFFPAKFLTKDLSTCAFPYLF